MCKINKTVYLVGPISGLSYDEVKNRYITLTKQIESIGYNTLCPIAGKKFLRNEKKFKACGYENPEASNHAIIQRDRWMVENSDILLADFTQGANKVSIGSCMEIAWGWDLKKLVIGIIPENNIHKHAFVLEACSVIFNKIELALNYLENMVLGIQSL